MGVDGEAGRLLGKSSRLAREAQLVPQQVDQIRRVGAVEYGERRVEPDAIGMNPQQSIGDAVECSRPGQAGALGASPRSRGARCRDDALRAAAHLLGRPPGEGQQQHALGIDAAGEQVCDAVGQGRGLARAGPGDDEKRRGGAVRALADPVPRRRPLAGSQAVAGARAARRVHRRHFLHRLPASVRLGSRCDDRPARANAPNRCRRTGGACRRPRSPLGGDRSR